MARMRSTKVWLGWLNPEDRTQYRWAVSYLISNGFGEPGRVKPSTYLENIEQELIDRADLNPDSLDSTLSFIKRMRAAWNAKKNRDTSRGRKAYSYVMSTDIEHKIRELAGKRPINETLEKIIDREYQHFKNDRKAFQLDLRTQRDHRERLQYKIDELTSHLENFKDQLEAEKAARKIMAETIKDLYLKIATQEIILRHANITKIDLTLDEQTEAITNQETRFDFFNRSLHAEFSAMGRRRSSKI